MDATNDRHTRGRRRRWPRRLRVRPHRQPPPPPSPPQRTNSLPISNSEFVENKMGLPPPYEQTSHNPAPPPPYFGDNPPPPPGLVVPPTAPRTSVIVPPPANSGTVPGKLGPGRTGMTCASCNRSMVTRVEYVPNNRTHIVSAALCVVAGCCCGCFIPYCMKSCKTANHYCPKCRAFVGSYTPS